MTFLLAIFKFFWNDVVVYFFIDMVYRMKMKLLGAIPLTERNYSGTEIKAMLASQIANLFGRFNNAKTAYKRLSQFMEETQSATEQMNLDRALAEQ